MALHVSNVSNSLIPICIKIILEIGRLKLSLFGDRAEKRKVIGSSPDVDKI